MRQRVEGQQHMAARGVDELADGAVADGSRRFGGRVSRGDAEQKVGTNHVRTGSVATALIVSGRLVTQLKPNECGDLCRKAPVFVSIDGVPSFELTPVEEDDDLVNRLITGCPEFVQMLESRKGSPSMTAQEALDRL